jgi:outer membrane protein assembly factor BamB
VKDSSRFHLFRRLGTLEKPVRYGAVAVHSVATSDDGKWLVSRGPSRQNSYGYLWSVDSDDAPQILGAKTPVTISRDGTRILGIEIDRDGASAIAWQSPSLGDGWQQRAWTGQCTRSDPAIARTHDLVAYGYDRPPVVHVRRVGNGVLCWRDDRPSPGRDPSARGLAFAGDRLYAITQHYAERFHHVVTAYDSATGDVIWEHDAAGEVARVVVAGDAIIALFRTILVFDANGTLVAERSLPVENQVIQAYAASPRGELFLGGEGFAQLVDASSGEELDRWPFPAKRFPTCAAFSADGNRLFLGTNSAVVLCYERR